MKKLYLSILYVVLLSILISGTILLSKPKEETRLNSAYNRSLSAVTINNNNNNNKKISYKNYVKKESIEVLGNTTDIDLQAYIVEDKSGQVSLNFKYKINGKMVDKKIETSSIAEIRNLFRLRKQQGDGYKLHNLILNKKLNKVYFIAERKKIKKYAQTSIYCYNLENSYIEKVFYDIGVFSKFTLSPDGKYNAFSYRVNHKNISDIGKSAVVIIRCSDNKILLNSNNDIIEHGKNISNFNVYSYNFIKWKSDNVCELIQEIIAKDNLKQVKKQSISYNINEKMSINK